MMYEHLRRHPEHPWQQGLEFVRRGRHWKLLVHAVALPPAAKTPRPTIWAV